MTTVTACASCQHPAHEGRCAEMIEYNEPGELGYWAQCRCEARKET